MAQDDIRGTVVDSSGTAVSGAVVEVTKAQTDGSPEEQTVIRTTTDTNGDYLIESHPDGDGTSQDWNVQAYYWDGSAWLPALNKPGVTADLPTSVIPDSVVSRPDDNNSGSGDFDVGLEFSTSQEWPDFQAKISANHSPASDETMVIVDSGGTDIASEDISSLTSGDVVTFSGVNLSANADFMIECRTTNSRTYGYYDSPSYPYTSSDGNLSITAGYDDTDSAVSGIAFAIVTIGNINL